MSEKDSDLQNLQNEEIINDITKGLEDHCILNDEINDSNLNDEPNKQDVFDDKIKESENYSFDDFVDEDEMKLSEENMSNDEKVQNKVKAEDLKQNGNQEFKNGNYLESINIYTKALRLCPLCYEIDRAILYSNRAASKQKLEKKECSIDDCTKALVLYPTYVKPLFRRAKLYEELDKLDDCLEDYKKLETLDPSNNEYKRTIRELSERIDKRNEELKTEMLGKLKDLGNIFLRPFGLSTENFQLNKDPNTGGYSVNFNQSK